MRTPADQESMRCVSCTAIEQALPRTLVGVIDRVSNNKVSLLEGDVQPLYRQSGPPPRVPAEGKRGARGCSFVNRTTLSELFQECYGSSRPRVYNIRQVCIHTIYIYIYIFYTSIDASYIYFRRFLLYHSSTPFVARDLNLHSICCTAIIHPTPPKHSLRY